jgi:hypothetical protein
MSGFATSNCDGQNGNGSAKILIVLARIPGRSTCGFYGLEVVLEFLKFGRGYDGTVALGQDFRNLVLEGFQP